MDGVGLPLALTAIFVAINGFFVAAEFALVKARRTRISILAQKGDKRAKVAEHILDHLELYLSGCQLGITAASLVLGWLAEPAIARLLALVLEALGVHLPEGVLHIVSLAFALIVVTMLHMVFGEQAPKIWAIHTADKMSLSIAYPIYIFVLVLKPLIALINASSNLLLRAIGIKSGAGEEATHDVAEIRAIVARSAKEGYLTLRQGEFAENILGLVDLEVRHILVPRVDIVALCLDQSREENLKTIRESGHTRFPLCTEDLDSVVGIVHAKDVLASLIDEDERTPPFDELTRPPIFVPETQPLSRLIVGLQSSQSGCAVVVDEHGTAIGLVFLDDALEEIVGPIRDEFDGGDEASIGPTPEGEFLLLGSMPLPEAREILDLDDLKGPDTIGGYVVSLLKRLPKPGDSIAIGPYDVAVVSVSRHRANKLRFTKRGEAVSEDSDETS